MKEFKFLSILAIISFSALNVWYSMPDVVIFGNDCFAESFGAGASEIVSSGLGFPQQSVITTYTESQSVNISGSVEAKFESGFMWINVTGKGWVKLGSTTCVSVTYETTYNYCTGMIPDGCRPSTDTRTVATN